MHSVTKKIIVGAVLAMLIAQPLAVPKTARAQIPVTDAALISITTSLQGAILGENTVQTGQTLFEWAETFILESLKKKILDMVVDNIVSYIQGGGKPRFVTDWKGFLEDAANEAVGDFVLNQKGLSFLCEPFQFQIKATLLPELPVGGRAVARCTLQDIVGNVENFYGDFQNGGWLAYSRSIEPQNNFIGAYLITQNEALNLAAKSKEAARNEAVAGGGFLSQKECQKDANGNDIASTCQIVTPGKTLGDITAKALGADIDSIISAKQLAEYVSAIANAAINRLTAEASKGLANISTNRTPRNNRGERPDFTPTDTTATDPCVNFSQATLGSLFDQAAYDSCLSYVDSTKGSFKGAKQEFVNEIEAVINTRKIAQETFTSVRASSKTFANLAADRNRFHANRCEAVATDFGDRPALVEYFRKTVPAGLTTLLQDSNAVSDELKKFKRDVERVIDSDWESLADLQTEFEGNETWSIETAQALRARSEFEASEDSAPSTDTFLDPDTDGGVIWLINYYDEACVNE